MRRGLTFSELSVGLVFVAIAALACLSPAQGDTFWALRAGEDLWRSGQVPLVDTYSHTAAGHPWPNHEWLWQAIAYGLLRAGGFPLLTLAVGAAVTGAYAIVYRLTVGPWPVRIGLLLVGLTLGTNVWSLRPQVASLLLLAVLLWLLVRGRHAFIPPLFALWANLHGGVVLGGLVMVAVTFAALVYERRRFPGLVLTTVLGGAATSLTPLGFGLWTFIGKWTLAARQTGISEWDPVLPVDRVGIVFWILALAFVALCARRWRHVGAWSDRLLVVTAAVLLPCAIRSVRNVSPFLLVAVPAAARLLASLEPAAPRRPAAGPERPRLNLALLAGFAAVAASAVVVCWTIPAAMLGWRPITPAAAAAIAACPEPLYNGYNVGGYLIWFVRGKRVFIDGRHDPYPPELIVEDAKVERGGDFRPLFRRYGIRCAALSADALLADNLRGAGWRSRFTDDRWVVLEAP